MFVCVLALNSQAVPVPTENGICLEQSPFILTWTCSWCEVDRC